MSIQRMAKEYAISLNKNNCKNENSEYLSNNWFYGLLKRCQDLHSLRIFLFPVQKVKLLKILLLTSTNYPQFSPAMVYPKQTKSTTLMRREYQLTIRHQRSSLERLQIPRQLPQQGHPTLPSFEECCWPLSTSILRNAEFLLGLISGSSWAMNDSGWSNGEILELYLTTYFAANVSRQNQDPILILLDGHRSHISLTLTDWAKRNNIIIFVLPPHSSHVTQPLDVGVFGPLKRIYNRECAVFAKKSWAKHNEI